MRPSGASASDCWSIRSVKYGCIRTRSHSPAPSGPGLSQIEFDTPSRPKSWTSPARRSVVHLVRRQPELRAAAPAASSATAPRVAERVRRLEVDEVGDRLERGVELRRPSDTTVSAGSASITASQVATESSSSKIFSASVAHDATSAGSNCCPARARASSRRRVDPAGCDGRPRRTRRAGRCARHRDRLAGEARRASPGRPSARTTPPSASSTASGSPSCSPSWRASGRGCSIMPSRSR